MSYDRLPNVDTDSDTEPIVVNIDKNKKKSESEIFARKKQYIHLHSVILLLTLSGTIALLVFVFFLLFELIGEDPIRLSSQAWLAIVGSFMGYYLILLMISVSALKCMRFNAQNKQEMINRLKIQHLVKIHIGLSISFILMFVLAYYTNTLSSTVSAFELMHRRNLLSVWFLIMIVLNIVWLYEALVLEETKSTF